MKRIIIGMIVGALMVAVALSGGVGASNDVIKTTVVDVYDIDGEPLVTHIEFENDVEGWTATQDDLNEVADNMGLNYSVNTEVQAQNVIDAFNALTIEDNVRNGVWGAESPEGRIKQLIEKDGETYINARYLVLIGDGMSEDEAEAVCSLYELYDAGEINWGMVVSIQKRSSDHPEKVKIGEEVTDQFQVGTDSEGVPIYVDVYSDILTDWTLAVELDATGDETLKTKITGLDRAALVIKYNNGKGKLN